MVRCLQPFSLLVLLVLATTTQGQTVAGAKELQPWLLGLTAVVVFLFIVLVLLLANRLWRVRMGRKQDDLQESPGSSRLERIGHVNPGAENESDHEGDKEKGNSATSL
ncbi:small integral membrane protein 24 [Heliangelus exortis]|uniref:small integral membrane protein 24 n=1 Tax=Heliangelus exortis TaxID=472823 RepID=UPI003A90C730